MFCTVCGSELKVNANYCTSCGAKIPKIIDTDSFEGKVALGAEKVGKFVKNVGTEIAGEFEQFADKN